MDVAENLQSLSYMVCAADMSNVLHLDYLLQVLRYCHYTPANCCYAMMTCEICLSF